QVTLSLSDKFQALIDSVAMQLGLEDEAAYLEHWARLPGGERPGSARDVGEAVGAELEARFPEYDRRAYRPAWSPRRSSRTPRASSWLARPSTFPRIIVPASRPPVSASAIGWRVSS